MVKFKGSQRPRKGSSVTTSKGVQLNRSLTDRRKASKQGRAAAKAEYLSTLPKERVKRIMYRLHPKRIIAFWFSRDGALMALKLTGIGIIVCFFLVIGLFAYFRKDLPKIRDISGDKVGGSISYYDRTGQTLLWQDYSAIKRTPVSGDQISPYLRAATVAIEDKEFYTEGAFNVRGIARAMFKNLTGTGGGNLQGGSTLTQQLVKLNNQWTADRTITRKVKELILAVELEKEYSKSDILTGYLNITPYGGIQYGAEAASQDYFHIPAKDLSLAQATMLAAIPQAPSYYSPYGNTQWNPSAGNTFNRDALIGRQHYILDQMVKQKVKLPLDGAGKPERPLTQKEADGTKEVDVLAQVQQMPTTKYKDIKAPYFVLSAKHELEQKYGAETVKRGGWKVVTTVDLKLQELAEGLVQKNINNVARYGGDSQALVAQDIKTGQMVAVVGGSDFSNDDHGKLNFAQINISPGSSFKPYDYATMIQNRTDTGAGSILYDVQHPLPGYPCTNKTRPDYTSTTGGFCLWDYDFRYPGAVSLRYALAGSRNVPAVKAMLSALPNDKSPGHVDSINKTISTANAMMGNGDAYRCYKEGVEDIMNATKADTTQCYAASAIGDGAYLHLDDHVNGLGTFARMGNAIPKTYILEIIDSSSKPIYKWTQPKGKQVIHQDTAFIVNSMLSDPKATYLPAGYKFQNYGGWSISVKTGTTNNNFDGLMTAWSPRFAVGAWVGYHTRNKAMTGSGMEYMTTPLARGFMVGALDGLDTKAEAWVKPATVKVLPAYVQRTHVGVGSVEPGPTTDYFPSWYTGRASASANTSQVIDKVSGGVATSCTPEGAKQTVGGANANSFSADIFYPVGQSGSSTTTTVSNPDNVHNCSDAKPSLTLTAPSTCDTTDNNGQGCTITVVATAGTHTLGGSSFGGTVTISVNGNQVNSQNVSDSPSTITFNYKPTAGGPATVTATVTDSVLYQATQSANVNMSLSAPAPGGGGNNGNNGNGQGAVLQQNNVLASTRRAAARGQNI